MESFPKRKAVFLMKPFSCATSLVPPPVSTPARTSNSETPSSRFNYNIRFIYWTYFGRHHSSWQHDYCFRSALTHIMCSSLYYTIISIFGCSHVDCYHYHVPSSMSHEVSFVPWGPQNIHLTNFGENPVKRNFLFKRKVKNPITRDSSLGMNNPWQPSYFQAFCLAP